MKLLSYVAVAGILCLPFAYGTTPAAAATAHNSQAGANGNTSNAQAPLHKSMMKKSMMKKRMKKM